MGLHIIKENTNINFIGARKIAFLVSLLLILAGIASLVIKGGPRYGIDFAGGYTVQVKFEQDMDLKDIKASMDDLDLIGLVVQRVDEAEVNRFMLRIPFDDTQERLTDTIVHENLEKGLPDVDFVVEQFDMVGPKVSDDLRSKALEALFYAVLLIAIYISGRFEQRWWAAGLMAAALATGIYLLQLVGTPMTWLILAAMIITLVLCWKLKLNYALGAVVALIHDVLITVGVFSILNKEFDLTIVAALLTIIGYSLNDTIIVFDRIRENLRGKLKIGFGDLLNKSINQTLSRTLMTSLTTLVVVACLYFFGGGVIHDFALALLIGIGVGTYSSIFVASPILLAFNPREEDEGAA